MLSNFLNNDKVVAMYITKFSLTHLYSLVNCFMTNSKSPLILTSLTPYTQQGLESYYYGFIFNLIIRAFAFNFILKPAWNPIW